MYLRVAMAMIPIHYVATMEEALELIKRHGRFWVSNCGCRERKGKCERSKPDVCLMFEEGTGSSGSGKREIMLAEVVNILNEAKSKHLVPRPFRSDDRAKTEGVCFCCDDCCAYFLDPKEECDKGAKIENTDHEKCNDCGICIDVCYFKARDLGGGKLEVDSDRCYGCGLCADVCPLQCVEMADR